MPRLLVLYGTTDGQTKKIAEALGNDLRVEGCSADVVNAADRAEVSPHAYDAVIVGASLHAGGYQRDVKRWVRLHAKELNRKPSAFVSVCLGVLEKNPVTDRNLKRIMGEFFDATNWHPGMNRIVAGGLPYTKYNFMKKWIMRRIVVKAGAGDTDTSRDYEYTDWADLKAFAHQFAEQCSCRVVSVAGAGPRAAETYLV
jgi:menaquinone-dependent protoporphyrinogen oxidase